MLPNDDPSDFLGLARHEPTSADDGSFGLGAVVATAITIIGLIGLLATQPNVWAWAERVLPCVR